MNHEKFFSCQESSSRTIRSGRGLRVLGVRLSIHFSLFMNLYNQVYPGKTTTPSSKKINEIHGTNRVDATPPARRGNEKMHLLNMEYNIKFDLRMILLLSGGGDRIYSGEVVNLLLLIRAIKIQNPQPPRHRKKPKIPIHLHGRCHPSCQEGKLV